MTSQVQDSHLSWQDEIIAEQIHGVPKRRGRTYYYTDGLYDRKQVWLTHAPGCDIPIRVKKVYKPGITGKEYDSRLEMNIGTEMDAYRLYLALQAYFNDERERPWFLTDAERVGDSQ